MREKRPSETVRVRDRFSRLLDVFGPDTSQRATNSELEAQNFLTKLRRTKYTRDEKGKRSAKQFSDGEKDTIDDQIVEKIRKTRVYVNAPHLSISILNEAFNQKAKAIVQLRERSLFNQRRME